VSVIFDAASAVGALGAVVRESGADRAEAPAAVLVVIAVKEYTVFEVAPVKAAGLVLFVVVGPEGVAVKSVDRVGNPVPPVHAILKVVGVIAVGTDKTGGVGGRGAVLYETVTDGVDDEPAEFFPVIIILYVVLAVSPV
jgi:hypothetical protein